MRLTRAVLNRASFCGIQLACEKTSDINYTHSAAAFQTKKR